MKAKSLPIKENVKRLEDATYPVKEKQKQARGSSVKIQKKGPWEIVEGLGDTDEINPSSKLTELSFYQMRAEAATFIQKYQLSRPRPAKTQENKNTLESFNIAQQPLTISDEQDKN